MTKKDFEVVARAIREARNGPTDGALDVVADYLVEEFQNDNPRFDRKRFILACGGLVSVNAS